VHSVVFVSEDAPAEKTEIIENTVAFLIHPDIMGNMNNAPLSNSIPLSFADLSKLTSKVVSGLNTHEPALAIVQNTATTVTKDYVAAAASLQVFENLSHRADQSDAASRPQGGF